MSVDVAALQHENLTLKLQLQDKDQQIQRLQQQLQQQNEEIGRLKQNVMNRQAHIKPSGAAPVNPRASLAMKTEVNSKALSPTMSSPHNSSGPMLFNPTDGDALTHPQSPSNSSYSDNSLSPTMPLNLSLKNQPHTPLASPNKPQLFARPSSQLPFEPHAEPSSSLVMGALPAAPKSSKAQQSMNLAPMGSNSMSLDNSRVSMSVTQPWRQNLHHSEEDDALPALPPPQSDQDETGPPPPPDSEIDADEEGDFIPPPPQFDLSSGLGTLNLGNINSGIDFNSSGAMQGGLTFSSAFTSSDTTVVHAVDNTNQSMFVEKTGFGNPVMKARVQPSSSMVFPCWQPPATGQHKAFVTPPAAPDCFIVRLHEGQSELDLLDDKKKKTLHNVNLPNQPVLAPGFDYNPNNFAPSPTRADSITDYNPSPSTQTDSLATQLNKTAQSNQNPLDIHNAQSGGMNPTLSSSSFGPSVNGSFGPSISGNLGSSSSAGVLPSAGGRGRGRSAINYSLPTADNNTEAVVDQSGRLAGLRSPSATRNTLADRHAANNHGIPALMSPGPQTHSIAAPTPQQQMNQIRHTRRHFNFVPDDSAFPQPTLAPSLSGERASGYNPRISIAIPPPPSDSLPMGVVTPYATAYQTGNGEHSNSLSSHSGSAQPFTSPHHANLLSPLPIASIPVPQSSNHNNSSITPKVISTTFDASAFRNDKNQINGKPKYGSLTRNRQGSTLPLPSSAAPPITPLSNPATFSTPTPPPQLDHGNIPSPSHANNNNANGFSNHTPTNNNNNAFAYDMPDSSILFSLPEPPAPSLSITRPS